MRFSDLCEKEVVNVKDCRCLGSVRDLDIDKECGKILALIVPGPGKYLGCFCRDSEFFIPWAKVIRIGPDIILVEFDEKDMKRRIGRFFLWQARVFGISGRQSQGQFLFAALL